MSVGKRKIIGKGDVLDHGLATEPQDVAVVLWSGDVAFCVGAGGTESQKTYKIGKRFKRSKNVAPASCPAP